MVVSGPCEGLAQVEAGEQAPFFPIHTHTYSSRTAEAVPLHRTAEAARRGR